MASECCWILKMSSFWVFNGFWIFINGRGVGGHHGMCMEVRRKFAGVNSHSTMWTLGTGLAASAFTCWAILSAPVPCSLLMCSAPVNYGGRQWSKIRVKERKRHECDCYLQWNTVNLQTYHVLGMRTMQWTSVHYTSSECTASILMEGVVLAWVSEIAVYHPVVGLWRRNFSFIVRPEIIVIPEWLNSKSSLAFQNSTPARGWAFSHTSRWEPLQTGV